MMQDTNNSNITATSALRQETAELQGLLNAMAARRKQLEATLADRNKQIAQSKVLIETTALKSFKRDFILGIQNQDVGRIQRALEDISVFGYLHENDWSHSPKWQPLIMSYDTDKKTKGEVEEMRRSGHEMMVERLEETVFRKEQP